MCISCRICILCNSCQLYGPIYYRFQAAFEDCRQKVVCVLMTSMMSSTAKLTETDGDQSYGLIREGYKLLLDCLEEDDKVLCRVY